MRPSMKNWKKKYSPCSLKSNQHQLFYIKILSYNYKLVINFILYALHPTLDEINVIAEKKINQFGYT